jgi:hypothetical protein
MVIRWA